MPLALEEIGFVSIPKNASNSIYEILPHAKEENHRALHKHNKKYPFTFAIVRHPYDRLMSWFFYHQFADASLPMYQQPFEEWVLRGCATHWEQNGQSNESGVTTPINQHEFICDQNGAILVDAVLRYETLQDSFSSMMGELGHTVDELPVLLPSPRPRNWQRSYQGKIKDKVLELCAKDFEVFWYE